ncbi:MAG: PIN domain-containing protein [Chloroflexi bacterium]|nr:PIN domain-containing protein [Chloroflexota bacterium]
MAVIIDTSYVVSLINPGEASHKTCLALAGNINTVLVVPVTILPEVAYLLESRLGHHIMRQTMAELLRPGWTLETLQRMDLERTVDLLNVYGDARLDFADATIIAIAERLNITTLLTLDRRHFRMIRPQHCEALELLP